MAPSVFIYPPFLPGTKFLNPAFKAYIKEIARAAEVSKFLRSYVGGYPNPLDPKDPTDPWGPLGPLVNGPTPHPNINNLLVGELVMDAVSRKDISKSSSSVMNAIRKEKVIPEALSELREDLRNVIKSLDERMKNLS